MVTLIWLMGIPLLLLAFALFLSACSGNNNSGGKTVYVKPSIDYKGKFRKGHIRRAVNTKKDAVQNQNRSRYYYQTRGKYRRKSKKN
jgi:hypothetical protein